VVLKRAEASFELLTLSVWLCQNDEAKRLIQQNLLSVDAEEIIRDAKRAHSNTDGTATPLDRQTSDGDIAAGNSAGESPNGDEAEEPVDMAEVEAIRTQLQSSRVFTVSALDYLRLKNLEQGRRGRFFEDEWDTEIPQLQSHLLGISHNMKDALLRGAQEELKNQLNIIYKHCSTLCQDTGTSARDILKDTYTKLADFFWNGVKERCIKDFTSQVRCTTLVLHHFLSQELSRNTN
jgi:hypothetical protein